MREDADLALEVVILLIFGVFVLLLGGLLPAIHAGALPYSPDSAYGLFLVLVALQVITLGRTPFGDLRRSWPVIVAGFGGALFGMSACFIPGRLAVPARVSVGVLLAAGGLSLMLRLLLSEKEARRWIRIPGMPRHLAWACFLVYALSVALGLITLFPGKVHDDWTAALLVLYGISFLYLAWVLQKATRLYPPEEPRPEAPSGWLREAALPLSLAVLVVIALLLTLLGVLLVPVNLGLLPFSPDGQQGLLLVVMAIQMMALGDTPVGHTRRSWPVLAVGVAFVAAGAFSCIVPGALTGWLRALLGTMNLLAGLVFFGRKFLEKGRAGSVPPGGPMARLVSGIALTQTMLNVIVIAFGITIFVPGLVPGLVNAAIIVLNGGLLFALAAFLWKLDTSAIGRAG